MECDIIPIDIGKSLKENIIMALNYQNEENVILNPEKNENENEKGDKKQKIIIKEKK